MKPNTSFTGEASRRTGWPAWRSGRVVEPIKAMVSNLQALASNLQATASNLIGTGSRPPAVDQECTYGFALVSLWKLAVCAETTLGKDVLKQSGGGN